MTRAVRFLFLASVVALTACARGPVTVQYDMSLNPAVQEPALRQQLIQAGMNVIQRRLSRLQEDTLDISVDTSGIDPRIKVGVSTQDTADQLTAELQSPFTFRLVKQITTGTGFVIEGQGTFAETGLTEKHVLWVEWAEDDTGKGAARIVLKPEGQELMRRIIDENPDTVLGIMSRGVLMSKTLPEKGQGEIIIRNIPNPVYAEIFADDVNVGLHSTFTPVQ